MDFLKNAAKIAEQVQGGKKHGEGSGGYGDMLGAFMGGGDQPKPKAKPNRDEEYDEQRPHGSKPKPRRDEDEYAEERPHGSSQSTGAEHKKKPSTGELFGSAQILYQAAAGGKVDQGKLAGAASDLLEGLSMYGGEKCPYSKYAQQASTYLDSYGKKHEVPGAHGSAKPSAGHGRPNDADEDSYPSKPRPSKYESEEFEYGDRPQKPRPSKYESEESEYGDRPQRPRPSKYEEEKPGYDERPQKPHPSKYEEEEEYGHRRPQKSQAEDEEYGVGYSRKPQKSQYEEEAPGPYGRRPQSGEGPYGSRPQGGEGPYGSRPHSDEGPYGSEGRGRGSKPSYNEEESEKPKKSWYE